MASSTQLLERSSRPSERAARPQAGRVLHRVSLSHGPSSDRRLANRASGGDRHAIGAIFARYRQELYGFCLGILGEPEDAQDALQNTMVKVLKALPGEEREIALRPWLYRIAHNEAVELRRTRRPTQGLDAHLTDGQSSVAERAEQRERLGWLLKDLADLPDRQRAVLVMRELNGLDFAEIGAALDTSAAVVRQALYEARRNLEQMGEGRGLGCAAVTRVLSDADGRTTRRRDIRAHLRGCPDCQRFQDAIESRKGALAAIAPAPAAAGIAQAAVGSSSGGAGVALSGGAAKSAGALGVLKAAGTVAVVAVLSTAAIQHEPRGEAPDRSSRHALADAPSNGSPALRKAKAGRSAGPAHDRRRVVVSSGGSAVASNRRLIERRPPSPGLTPALASSAHARPVDAPLEASAGAGRPVVDAVPEPSAESSPSATQWEPPDRASKPGKQLDRGAWKAPEETTPAAQDVPPGQGPGKQTGRPPKPEKAAKREEPTPPAALPPPASTAPAEGGAEPPPPVEDAGPNGKAKGHEKHPAPIESSD
jgi:RNA polymerase sigma factor (sigma-70 family)